jgi:hypothetical protein
MRRILLVLVLAGVTAIAVAMPAQAVCPTAGCDLRQDPAIAPAPTHSCPNVRQWDEVGPILTGYWHLYMRIRSSVACAETRALLRDRDWGDASYFGFRGWYWAPSGPTSRWQGSHNRFIARGTQLAITNWPYQPGSAKPTPVYLERDHVIFDDVLLRDCSAIKQPADRKTCVPISLGDYRGVRL